MSGQDKRELYWSGVIDMLSIHICYCLGSVELYLILVFLENHKRVVVFPVYQVFTQQEQFYIQAYLILKPLVTLCNFFTVLCYSS